MTVMTTSLSNGEFIYYGNDYRNQKGDYMKDIDINNCISSLLREMVDFIHDMNDDDDDDDYMT